MALVRAAQFASQLFVYKALAGDLRNSKNEAVIAIKRIVFGRTIVEAERLLSVKYWEQRRSRSSIPMTTVLVAGPPIIPVSRTMRLRFRECMFFSFRRQRFHPLQLRRQCRPSCPWLRPAWPCAADEA